MKETNNVKVLDDGRVEITLLMPLPLFEYKKWVKFYLPECELIVKNAKITAIRCNPLTWENTLKSLTPESLGHFRKIIEKGTGKKLNLFRLIALEF